MGFDAALRMLTALTARKPSGRTIKPFLVPSIHDAYRAL
jgi:hypothetical protein